MSLIPLKFTSLWFKEINTFFLPFYREIKNSAGLVTNVIKLQRKGGIGILDIHHYYIAYNSRYTPPWACNEKEYERNWPEEKTKGI